MDSRVFQADFDIIFSKAIFLRLTNSKYIDGSKGAGFLKTSKLSQNVLHAIWDVADSKNEGELDTNGFSIACRLVAHAQMYNICNPMSLIPLVSTPPLILPKFDLTIFAHEFDALFAQLDADSDGFITGKDARNYYLSTTNYDTQTLMRLWDLADVDSDGFLSKPEFYTMQLLIGTPKDKSEIETLDSSYYKLSKANHHTSQNSNLESARDKQSISPTNLPPHSAAHDKYVRVSALPSAPNKNTIRTAKGILNDVSSVRSDELCSPNSINRVHHTTSVLLNDNEDLLEREQRKLQLLRDKHKSLLETSQHTPSTEPYTELELLRSHADDLCADIADLKLKNESLINSVTQTEANLSLLHASKKNHALAVEREEELLKAEQRELEQLKITLQAMKRNKQLLQKEVNMLNERLHQCETTTKIMIRALEDEQSKILNVKNERLSVSQEKLQIEQEMRSLSNQALIQVMAQEKNNNSQLAIPGSERDSKGIRVASIPNSISQ